MEKTSQFYQIPRIVNVRSIHTAFSRDCGKDFNFDGEIHNFWELVYIVKGRAGVAKNEQVYTLGRGDIVFHPPMEYHRLWSGGEGFSVIVITFNAEGSFLDPLSKGFFTLASKQRKALSDLLDEIDETFIKDGITLKERKKSSAWAQQVAGLLELFLLDILKMEGSEQKIPESGSARDFAQVAMTMNAHIEENLSVPELARLTNLSISNLKKIVKKYTGTGVSKHFLTLKISRAISLLQKGASVTEVSEKLGFSSQNYFSFVFRRETGKMPKEFK